MNSCDPTNQMWRCHDTNRNYRGLFDLLEVPQSQQTHADRPPDKMPRLHHCLRRLFQDQEIVEFARVFHQQLRPLPQSLVLRIYRNTVQQPVAFGGQPRLKIWRLSGHAFSASEAQRPVRSVWIQIFLSLAHRRLFVLPQMPLRSDQSVHDGDEGVAHPPAVMLVRIPFSASCEHSARFPQVVKLPGCQRRIRRQIPGYRQLTVQQNHGRPTFYNHL